MINESGHRDDNVQVYLDHLDNIINPANSRYTMGYNLAVLGCGTMGVAILSGVLKSLEARLSLPLNDEGSAGREPPSGISTPTASQFLNAPEDTLPSNFAVTVGREETVRKLRKVFKEMGRLGEAVDVRGGPGVNVQTASEADVILIWSVPAPLVSL